MDSMKLFLILRTIFSYMLCGIGVLIFIPPAFLIACLPARFRYDNKVFFWLLDCFYTWIIYASLNPVTFIGKKNLPNEPAIFAANHQSTLDILVVGSLLNGYPHVWLVLAYYVDAPILGFFIKRMFVPVERDQPVKAAGALRKIIKFIQDQKRHLIIYPEGTRHTDGKIHEFYEGFALVAKRTGRPVIPVFMPNNAAIYPPHSFYIYNYPLDIIIGKPFYYRDDESVAEFVKRVRAWFVDEYKKYHD